MCRLSCSAACGILVPWPGVKPAPPALEGGFLTAGPPGKSPVLLNLLKLVLWPLLVCDFSWRTFHVYLNVYSTDLDIMSYRYLLSLTGILCHLKLPFPYWFSVWMLCPFDVSGLWKSLTITALLLFSSFMSVSICFIYIGAPVLGVYMLMSVIASFINPFSIL